MTEDFPTLLEYADVFFRMNYNTKYEQFSWHSEIAEKLTNIFLKKNEKNLIICMPPRFGKSELGIKIWITYCLAFIPDCNFIIASSTLDLARSHVTCKKEEHQMILFPPTEDFLNNSIKFGNELVRICENTLKNSASEYEVQNFLGYAERAVEKYLKTTIPLFVKDINGNLAKFNVPPVELSDEDDEQYFLFLFGAIAEIIEKFRTKKSEETKPYEMGLPSPWGEPSSKKKTKTYGDQLLSLEKHFVRLANDINYHLKSFVEEKLYPLAGFHEYVWHTRLDLRVVGNPDGLYPFGTSAHQDHYHREGKVFRWVMPPEDGHPGKAPGCRCYSRTIVSYDEDGGKNPWQRTLH